MSDREALLPEGYRGGPVDLVEIGGQLLGAPIDRVEFGRLSWRTVVPVALLTLAGLAAIAVSFVPGVDETGLEITLTIVGVGVLTTAAATLLSRVRPRWRPALERLRWVSAAIARLGLLAGAAIAFASALAFALIRAFDTEYWRSEIAVIEWVPPVTAIGCAGAAALFSLRAPLLHIDARWSWVHTVATPLPSIVTAILTLVTVALTPLIPAVEGGGQPVNTSSLVSTLAAVAAVVAAVGAAWASIAVSLRQHQAKLRRQLASALLDVAEAARLDRETRTRAARHALHGTLARLSNELQAHRSGASAGAEVADKGVRLVVEGTHHRLTGLALAPGAAPYARSIDHYLGQPRDARLVAGLEALCRELAARVRSGHSSTPAQYAAALAAIDGR